jgi:hypothetical protein
MTAGLWVLAAIAVARFAWGFVKQLRKDRQG